MTKLAHTHVLRLQPRASHWARLREVCALSASLYNAALEERISHYRAGVRRAERLGLDRPSEIPGWRPIRLFDQNTSLTVIRRADPSGYGSLPVSLMRGVLRRLDVAHRRFLSGKGGFPRFRSAKRYRTLDFTEISGVRMTERAISFKAFGVMITIRTRRHRPFPNGFEPKTLRIVLRERRMELHVAGWADFEPAIRGLEAVGYDAGVAQVMTSSDGVTYPNLRIGAEARRKRLGLEREIARSKRGSNRWRKRIKRLLRLREREANARRTRAHQISRAIADRSAVVVMEKLSLRNMTRSAAGTAEAPGVNVRAKSGLNREILDVGIGLIRDMVRYKAERAGGELVLVNPAFTSRTCSGCGSRRHGFEQRTHRCLDCGQRMDRDLNAARNLLALHTYRGVVTPGARTA